jgi:colicin import membrane protein
MSLAGKPGLRPRAKDGWGPGVAMALGVHLMLVAALALGVRWKINNPAPIEAEVWSEIPQAAAPQAPVAPSVLPPTEVKPPAVEPPPEPVRAAEPEPPAPEPIPDVVVARERPKKERKKTKHREPVEVFETAPPKLSKKADKPAEKPPAKVAKLEPPAKPTPAKVAAAEPAPTSAQDRENQRRANLQRMMSELGSLGTSSRSSGPSAAYGGRIKARIKPNIVFTDNVSGNPLAVVEVRCAPDGRIMARKLLEPSGVASWDEAVLRAIDRTEVLPVDETGHVPAIMQIEFRPKDF